MYPLRTGSQQPAEAIRAAVTELAARFGASVGHSLTDLDLEVQPERLFALVHALNADPDLAFDYLRNIAGVDNGEEGMAVKYQLYSFRHGHALQVTVPTSSGHPHIGSLVPLFPAADWHEREAAEMFGFVFDGHPNPKNLLLEEDLHIHPLLKAHPLQKAELKQGIEDGPPGFTF
jgi:NADH-quinone oxidoreductase subunit C